MEYINGSTIPVYIMNKLKKDGTTVISRSRIIKYGEDGLKKIFADEGVSIKIEIKYPLILNKNKNAGRPSQYPKDATYLLHQI